MRKSIASYIWMYCVLGLSQGLWAQLPPNFTIEQVSSNWFSVTGIQFDEAGHLWGWSKFGQVFIAKEDYAQPQLLLDISEEVVTYGDLGLLGFALHPNFSENGYIYLLYIVDPHYFHHFGTDSYDPTKSETHQATIGRLTRYTVDRSTDEWFIDPDSRKVLMGAQGGPPGRAFAMLFDSHGVGSLVFGADGSLLVSCGDGAAYKGIDAGAFGEKTGSFRAQALQAGIIRPDQDIGTFRSQYLHSPNGKILRLDPETGAGYPSNPFYQEEDPFSTASRVWALGFRQPFRFALKPGTGDHDPSKGNPGTFILGEVGWAYWEELNVIDRGGKNYGWPIYGGMNPRWEFNRWASPTPNLRAADTASICDRDYFLFQDLLLEDTLFPRPFFPHPCNPNRAIPADIPQFIHQRPVISWSNKEHNPEEQGTHIPGFDSEGRAKIIRFEEKENPVKGETFTGACSVGGTFYTGDNFPPEYQLVYFHADYSGWIRQFIFGPSNELLEVKPFADTTKNIVSMVVNPKDGALYYIRYGFYSSLYKISYGGNALPKAKIKQDVQYGPSPLQVQFASHLSEDPDGDSLSIWWDFGDGEVSQQASPSHVFSTSDDQPSSFWVHLKVADQQGGIDSTRVLVSLNNTPPSVNIESPMEGLRYSRTDGGEHRFEALVTDTEHDATALTYEWQSFLHHNTHNHPNPVTESHSYTLSTLPLGCEDETYYYRISLTVTDAHGLSSSDEVLVPPDCGPSPAHFQTFHLSPTSGGISLKWGTLSESSCEYFEIAHRTDSGEFEVLTQVPGSLHSSQSLRYSYLHSNPSLGKNYYQIKAVNSYGTREGPDPQSALYFPQGNDFLVFPNPGNELLNVQVWDFVGPVSFRLYTPSGREVYADQWLPEPLVPQKMDTGLLPPGIYLYQIDNGQKVYHGKWLKP